MSDLQANVAPLRRNLKTMGIVIALAAAAVVATGIHSRLTAHHEMAQWSAAQAIPTVNVVHPQAMPQISTLSLPGHVAADVNAPIYAQVSGYLQAWYEDIGAKVKAGQLLGVVQTPDLDQQLRQAKADLQVAAANEKLAASTAARWTEMLKQDAVSQQDADEKTDDLLAKQATVQANLANVRRLTAMEAFKRVVAPFDGVITSRRTDIGDLITTGDQGQPLFTVSAANKLRVYVDVPQSEVSDIQVGMKASLTVPEHPGEPFPARVISSDHSISATSGTLLVQLAADNTAGLLTPGDYANVSFAVPTQGHGMTVPAAAEIFRDDGLQLAVVGADNKVTLKNVTVETDFGKTIEIGSGLTSAEQIIANPPDSINTGDEVHLAGADNSVNHRRERDHV